MKKLLLAGAAALLLTGATADPSFAAMHGGFSGGGHAGGGSFSGGGRVGGSFNAGAPRAAVTGGNFSRGGSFNRGATFSGRTGTFAGRAGTFAGRGGTWAGRGGHWGWRNGRRFWIPGAAIAAGVGLGLAYGGWGYDDCVVWNGWRYVNTCVGPTVSWGWGGPGWGGPGWGGPGWW